MTIKQARQKLRELVEKQEDYLTRRSSLHDHYDTMQRERAVLFGLKKALQAINEAEAK